MTIRNLPKAAVTMRVGSTALTEQAINRWNPDVRAAADDKSENTISILDPIGADWLGEGVTAKRIAAALRNIGEGKVVVNINSPGGDYFEGLAIYNMLVEHSGEVEVNVLGIAASAASIIAMAGDKVSMARASFLMIHNTWVMAAGDRNAFRDVADWLEPFDQAAADIYSARTDMTTKETAAMMDAETWIGGAKAVDQGFADEILSAENVDNAAKNDAGAGPNAALRKLDLHLSRAGLSRTNRRELVAAAKGGMPGAASSGMSSAAVHQRVKELSEIVKSL